MVNKIWWFGDREVNHQIKNPPIFIDVIAPLLDKIVKFSGRQYFWIYGNHIDSLIQIWVMESMMTAVKYSNLSSHL